VALQIGRFRFPVCKLGDKNSTLWGTAVAATTLTGVCSTGGDCIFFLLSRFFSAGVLLKQPPQPKRPCLASQHYSDHEFRPTFSRPCRLFVRLFPTSSGISVAAFTASVHNLGRYLTILSSHAYFPSSCSITPFQSLCKMRLLIMFRVICSSFLQGTNIKYTGIMDCISKTVAEEGAGALFKVRDSALAPGC
jgi:hypothetical protein